MRVVFIQKYVPHYRLPFFEGVKEELGRRGMEFILLYGPPDPIHDWKLKAVYPEWGIRLDSKMLKVKDGRYFYWQGAGRHIKKGDFVVAEHAAKLLDNYPLFLKCRLGRIKLGYFGHGENFQASTEFGIAKVLKKMTLKPVTRWFAYTEVSRQSLLRQGVSDDTITVVNNTLDKPESDIVLNATPNPLHFVYIGGLYREKLIPMLLEASSLVAEKYPGFHLDIVGDGPDKHIAESAAEKHDWITVHGPLYGEAKDEVVSRCSAILMPGLVGLVAIDSFLYRRPLITSDAGEHSPEIAYLEHEKNSLIDKGSPTSRSYANLLMRFLDDPQLRETLVQGCNQSAQEYTMENMVKRFCDGIELDHHQHSTQSAKI